MQIETFSIIAGTSACNASCPFCVSKMTGLKEVGSKPKPINWINFKKACHLAQMNKVSSIIITGKGEPTLYPEQISNYLMALERHNFPIVELQTNGILLEDPSYQKYLRDWHHLGLGLIALSIVHYDPEKNRQIYLPHSKRYLDLKKLVDQLHQIGYTVRLSCILLEGFIDSPDEVKKLIDLSKSLGVEQLSLRPVTRPKQTEDKTIHEFTGKHLLPKETIEEIRKFLDKKGNRLTTFGHGTILYDVEDQNVCLTNALTIKPKTAQIRQIIFFPDGQINFDWQFKGAKIL